MRPRDDDEFGVNDNPRSVNQGTPMMSDPMQAVAQEYAALMARLALQLGYVPFTRWAL